MGASRLFCLFQLGENTMIRLLALDILRLFEVPYRLENGTILFNGANLIMDSWRAVPSDAMELMELIGQNTPAGLARLDLLGEGEQNA